MTGKTLTTLAFTKTVDGWTLATDPLTSFMLMMYGLVLMGIGLVLISLIFHR
jgi:hypothetical protein|tara:strand:- start:167 stop:322 length:156 start_codon:yes stop_codon:yes gene_type:complete